MVCAQVIGNDATITLAGASGNFELNVMLPVIGRCLLESLTFLASSRPAAGRPLHRRDHRRRGALPGPGRRGRRPSSPR